jgi:glucose-6-phosphate 1-epimerase
VHHTVLSQLFPKFLQIYQMIKTNYLVRIPPSPHFTFRHEVKAMTSELNLSPKLKALLDRCDFLQLTSSTEALAGSRGAGLPLLQLNTTKCRALIALQGAHLLNFYTTKGKPLLWLSPNCDFTPGIALRGGIPVCLPWFGPHPTDSTKPKHGFARNREWQLIDASLNNEGVAELVFEFDSPANDLFPFNFRAQLVMLLGDNIKQILSINNTDVHPFDCSWVLHSYFPVASLAGARVEGLTDKTYLDNLEQHAAKPQAGDVIFPYEVDRVFPGVENPVVIAGSPRIRITHDNCPSVVVWNPGATNAAKIADIGAGNEQRYICVERGAVLGEKWHLATGETKMAWMEITEV